MGIRSRKYDIYLDRGLQFRRFATHGLHYIDSYASPTHTSSVYSLRVSESNVSILAWVGMQPQNSTRFAPQNVAMILAHSVTTPITPHQSVGVSDALLGRRNVSHKTTNKSENGQCRSMLSSRGSARRTSSVNLKASSASTHAVCPR